MEVLTLRGDFPKSNAMLARVTNREAHAIAIRRESQVERDTLPTGKFPRLSAVRITHREMASVGVQDVLTVGRPGSSVCQDPAHTARGAGWHGQNPERRLGLGTFCRTSDQQLRIAQRGIVNIGAGQRALYRGG